MVLVRLINIMRRAAFKDDDQCDVEFLIVDRANEFFVTRSCVQTKRSFDWRKQTVACFDQLLAILGGRILQLKKDGVREWVRSF